MTTSSGDTPQELLPLIRALLIPMAHGDEQAVAEAVAGSLSRAGLSTAEGASLLHNLFSEWQVDGDPPPLLKAVVVDSVQASSDPSISGLSSHYFNLHRTLRSQMGLSFSKASALLSYTSLVSGLANVQLMSAAQIAVLLRARGDASNFPWRAIQRLLKQVGAEPSLDEAQLSAVLDDDIRRNEQLLLDARWSEAVEFVSERAGRFGFVGAIGSQLSELAPEDGSIHWPYLHILHYALIPLGVFDHPPEYWYEFSPRSTWATHTFGPIYAPLTNTAENPILNNAKAFDLAGPWWSDPKVRQVHNSSRSKAQSLVDLLSGIGSLAPHSKRELSALVRAWCLRQVKLFSPAEDVLEGPPSAEEIGVFLGRVADGGTGTRGVIEQRVVDAVAVSSHRGSNWRARGLGDSVNAANLPRRKLGDCEFQDTSTRKVHAFEAHGGHLTEGYVKGHLASLKRVVPYRIEEDWGSPDDWTVKVTFVSHSFEGLPIEPFLVEGVEIETDYMTFSDLAATVDPHDLVAEFSMHVWRPIGEARTPPGIRKAYREILQGGT